MTPMTPQEFVQKWRSATVTESAAAQSHFNDLCDLLGHPQPLAADPHGAWFAFEKGASKASGGQGWADVWKRDCFGWEYKGKHANLDKAYAQLLMYYGALDNPPLLIVCDIDTIRIHTHFTNTVRKTEVITLADLLIPAKLDLLRQAFTDPAALRSAESTIHVTERAATQFARIAQLLRAAGNDPQQVAHYLIRLLFCLFAEDVGILPSKLFTRLVTRPRQNATAFRAQLRQLFSAMAEGGYFGVDTISHVDGGLFNDDAALLMDDDSLRTLAEVSAQDWGAIEPAILGTLFERGLDPDKRSQLGAHFTAKDDILLIVEPVLMAPLRRRWDAVRAEALALAAELADIDAGIDADKSAVALARRRTARTRTRSKLTDLLLAFRQELAAVQILDPACGSGNFLYVALRLLLDLEKEAIGLEASLGGTFPSPLVTPAQLHGIEINPYAHELAQATIWIGYIQWFRDNGFGLPSEPILKPLDTIRQMDAVLAYDPAGQPVEPPWPPADVIIGNPPFLGSSKLRAELGDAYVQSLTSLYGARLPACDLVCYWFEKACDMVAQGKAKRAGLLATQAIRGGANRAVVERIKQTGDIFWAYSDRDWVLDGATVHVSMIGFDDGTDGSRLLNDRVVETINSDLTSATDLTVAQRLAENLGLSFKGAEPGGPFDIDSELASKMLAAPLNINSRPNADVVRPVLNAADLMQRSRGMYTIDFGTMSEEEAASYELPFKYVVDHVHPIRTQNREAIRAKLWWRYARPRPEMRAALETKKRYIATAGVSKHRAFVWLDGNVLCNNLICVIAREDDYFLGVLQSTIHELWARHLGTQLREAESGQRYTNTTSFETYPFPWPPGQEPPGDPHVAAIAAAARDLVAKRDAWLNPPAASAAELKQRTLTNLYNQRPAWLALAHRRLDAAVLAAYGWPPDLTDEQLLARLLELNRERASSA